MHYYNYGNNEHVKNIHSKDMVAVYEMKDFNYINAC